MAVTRIHCHSGHDVYDLQHLLIHVMHDTAAAAVSLYCHRLEFAATLCNYSASSGGFPWTLSSSAHRVYEDSQAPRLKAISRH